MPVTKDILDATTLNVEDPAEVAAFYDAWADACRFETGKILKEMHAEGIIDEAGKRISKNVPADMLNPSASIHQQ